MINVFEVSAGMSGTKMLPDKAYRESLYDTVKKVSDFGDQIEDKQVINESQTPSNKRLGPMNVLIAKEIFKDTKALQKPSTVVARLMGLEAFPKQSTTEQRVNVHHEMLTPCQCPSQLTNTPTEHRIYKDVYEVRQQPSRISHFKDETIPKERHTPISMEKKMSIVRQKFMEAKRLARNQKLLHSKEFQDALEVLSSNRDVFLKFLEEHNSLFSTCATESHTVSTPSELKCITVLKPSKMIDMGSRKLLNDHQLPVEARRHNESKAYRDCDPDHPKVESFSRKTRIVVLKPGLGKFGDRKTTTASSTLPFGLPEERCLFDGPEIEQELQSRDVVKENAQQMHESCSSNRVDETVFPSVQSNGYVADESSFNRSDDEFSEEECGDSGDSELMNPISRRPWDYESKLDSPCSQHSLCQSLSSPESYVIRDAKKQLSERWIKFPSNQMNKTGRPEWRNTITLGEILAATKTNEVEWDEVHTNSSSRSFGRKQDLMVASPHSNGDEVGFYVKRSLNLQRSRSLPLPSPGYENAGLDLGGPESQVATSILHKDKERSKLRNGKSSFKEKFSNFFLFKTKKSAQGKSSSSSLSGQSYKLYGHLGKRSNDPLHFTTDSSTTGNLSYNFEKSQIGNPCPSINQDRPIQRFVVPEIVHGKDKHHKPRSVLEQPFKGASSKYAADSASCERTISRSPPIESVVRSLTHDGSILTGRIKRDPFKHTINFLKADAEEKERDLFVQSLLTSAGLGTETSCTFLARWHSLESPLNPALLDKFLEYNQCARCREKRSNQRLLFDCVNAALLEISWTRVLSIDWLRTSGCDPATNSVTEDVQRRIKEWFSNDNLLSFNYGETCSLGVETFVRKEISGKMWPDTKGSEVAEIGMLIQGQVMEELVGEALDDFLSGRLQ